MFNDWVKLASGNWINLSHFITVENWTATSIDGQMSISQQDIDEIRGILQSRADLLNRTTATVKKVLAKRRKK